MTFRWFLLGIDYIVAQQPTQAQQDMMSYIKTWVHGLQAKTLLLLH